MIGCYLTMNKEKFAEWLAGQLAERDMTQADLSRKSGVSDAQLSRLLRAERGVGESSVSAIARALGLPPETVFREAGLLPPESKPNKIIKAIEYLANRLPVEEQAEILEYTRMRVRLAERRDAKKRPRGIAAAESD